MYIVYVNFRSEISVQNLKPDKLYIQQVQHLQVLSLPGVWQQVIQVMMLQLS